MAFRFITKNDRFGNKAGITTTSTPSPIVDTTTPETITGLLGTEIGTGMVSTTAVITKGGDIAQTVALSDISFWIKTNDKVEIHSKDLKPLILGFTSATESALADTRLQSIMNGAII